MHTLKMIPALLLGGLIAGCGGSEPSYNRSPTETLRKELAAGSQITVVARGSLADNWGPVMEVRANGQWLGRVEVRSTQDQSYQFSTPSPLPKDRVIEVSFVNDAVVNGADRNLYVRAISVDGTRAEATAPEVRYRRGWDEIAGQEAMLWNGTLRFPMTPDAESAHTFSWPRQNVWQYRFDEATALSEWRFVPGAEFGPGAQGKLSLVAGESGGQAMALTYSTVVCTDKGCPVYAAAKHELKHPVQADTLRFRIKNDLPREARVYALVKDSSTQMLQYRPERCPFESAEDDWCTLQIDLRRPHMSWGGANNGVLQGAVTEVSILVQALEGVRGRTPLQGQLQFDDVTLANAPDRVALIRTPPSETMTGWRHLNHRNNAARWGVATHLQGSRADTQRTLQQAKEAGFGFVRTDLFWNHVERTPGHYDFSVADQWLDDADALGLKILFILDYDNPLYKNGVLMSTESERGAFAAYAAAAAARFKGRGVKFEIWNEQNSGAVCSGSNIGFWLPTPNAQHYAQLVKATMNAIRAVDPHVEVTLGGITPSFTSPCSSTENTQFSFQYLDALDRWGGLSDVNALGYHAYYNHAEPWGAELHMLRTLLREKNQTALQVWDTEWGVSSACPDDDPCAQGDSSTKRDRQAVRLARRMLVGLFLGLPVNVWYDLIDDGNDPNRRGDNFGLLDRRFNPKPAWAAMKTLSSLSKERVSGAFHELPPGMHALRFQQGANTVYAVWVEHGSLLLAADREGLLSAVDVQGRALPLTDRWTLEEKRGPIYLTYRTNTRPNLPTGP